MATCLPIHPNQVHLEGSALKRAAIKLAAAGRGVVLSSLHQQQRCEDRAEAADANIRLNLDQGAETTRCPVSGHGLGAVGRACVLTGGSLQRQRRSP